jgi:hypothetical protein
LVDRGRIVVVGAGFGLWQGGRCLAAGKWTDIASLRAYTRDTPAQAICIVIRLRDGSEVEIQEEAPGWEMFVNTLPSKLPGTPNPETWIPEIRLEPSATSERSLFERRAGGLDG